MLCLEIRGCFRFGNQKTYSKIFRTFQYVHLCYIEYINTSCHHINRKKWQQICPMFKIIFFKKFPVAVRAASCHHIDGKKIVNLIDSFFKQMSNASDDERRPLLTGEDGDPLQASSDATTVAAETSCCRLRCQGCFLVEPILVLFALGIFPLSIISQK